MPRIGRIFTTSAQIYVTSHYEIFVVSRFSFLSRTWNRYIMRYMFATREDIFSRVHKF